MDEKCYQQFNILTDIIIKFRKQIPTSEEIHNDKDDYSVFIEKAMGWKENLGYNQALHDIGGEILKILKKEKKEILKK